MANFTAAFTKTMGHEGGYANNPLDTGGETYKGIARNFNPTWGGWHKVDQAKKKTGVVAQLDRLLSADAALQADVQKFYKLNYWDVNRLDLIDSQALGEKLFDIGVNMGVKRAALMLQQALNLTNVNGRAYRDIAEDGVIGPETLSLADAHPRPALLLKVINALQAERYLNIMRNNPTQETFANSWFSRVAI